LSELTPVLPIAALTPETSWTLDQESTISQIIGETNCSRLEAIRQMRRREATGNIVEIANKFKSEDFQGWEAYAYINARLPRNVRNEKSNDEMSGQTSDIKTMCIHCGMSPREGSTLFCCPTCCEGYRRRKADPGDWVEYKRLSNHSDQIQNEQQPQQSQPKQKTTDAEAVAKSVAICGYILGINRYRFAFRNVESPVHYDIQTA